MGCGAAAVADPCPRHVHGTHQLTVPSHIHHWAPQPAQNLLSEMDPMIAPPAVHIHTPQPKSHPPVPAGEVRMKLAPLQATCQITEKMWAPQAGALVVRTWKEKSNPKVRAPTKMSLAVRAGNLAVTRSQAVEAAAVPQSDDETPKAKPDEPPPKAPSETDHNISQAASIPEVNDKDSEEEQQSNHHDFVQSLDKELVSGGTI